MLDFDSVCSSISKAGRPCRHFALPSLDVCFRHAEDPTTQDYYSVHTIADWWIPRVVGNLLTSDDDSRLVCCHCEVSVRVQPDTRFVRFSATKRRNIPHTVCIGCLDLVPVSWTLWRPSSASVSSPKLQKNRCGAPTQKGFCKVELSSAGWCHIHNRHEFTIERRGLKQAARGKVEINGRSLIPAWSPAVQCSFVDSRTKKRCGWEIREVGKRYCYVHNPDKVFCQAPTKKGYPCTLPGEPEYNMRCHTHKNVVWS